MKKKGSVKKLTTIALVSAVIFGGGLLGYEEYYNNKYRDGIRPSTKIDPKIISQLRSRDREKYNKEVDTSKYNIELYSTNKAYLGNPDTRNDIWIETLDKIESELFDKGLGLDEEIKEVIKNCTNSIKENLDSLSNEKVYIEVLKMNGHLKTNYFSLDVDLGSDKFYPIGLGWYGDEVYVVDANKEYVDLIGMRVDSINDISTKDIFQRINKFVSGKTEEDKKFNNVDMLNFYILKWIGIIKENNDFQATFKFSKGDKVEQRILPLEDVSKLMKPKFSINSYNNIPKIEDKSIYETIWSKYDGENDMFYIKFDKIIDSLSAATYEPILKFNYLSREDIRYNINEKIKESDEIKKVVLDFRGCDPKALELTEYFMDIIFKSVDDKITKYIILDKNSDLRLLQELSVLKKQFNFDVIGQKPYYFFYDNQYCKQEYDLMLNAGIFVGYPINAENLKSEELEFDIIIHENKNNYDNKIDTIYEYISNLN